MLVLGDVYINGVVAVGTTDAFLEGQGHHLRMLAQPPDVGLVASQTGTVDAALLTGADADSLTVLDVADAVRLCIFQRDECDDEVALGISSESLVLGGDVLEECGVVKLDFITALFEGDAKALLTLDRFGLVRRVYLDDVVGALALVLQNLDSLGGIVGGNDNVAHLTLQQQGGSSVAGVAECYEVTIARHAVSTACTGISTGDRAVVQSLDIVDKVNLLQRVA